VSSAAGQARFRKQLGWDIIMFVNDQERQRRAEARRTWPIRSHPLAEEQRDDLSEQTTALERLAMMWPLALASWHLTGQPLPSYERSTIPGKISRPEVRTS
jgi:hypothetical protein